jgi:glycosyltransferase involved in cell wall biosynthesis
MKIAYYGPFGLSTGYARAAADYAVALARAGAIVELHPLYDRYCDNFLTAALRDELGGLRNAPGAPDVLLVHEAPAAAVSDELLAKLPADDETRTVLLTTWETDRVPAALATRIADVYDKVAVPSGCAQRAFGEGGLEVAVIPHCFDPAAWPALAPAGPPYTIYSIGTWDGRKNPLGLLTAYLSEFYDEPGLEILLRLHTDDGYDAGAVARHIQHAMNLRPELCPRFVVTAEALPAAGVAALHAAGHLYVSTARGEAWCLPAFEAACRGRPVIAPAFGGQEDYLADLSGWNPTLDSQMTSAVANLIPKRVAGLPALVRVVPEGVDATQLWGEPDLDELRSLLRFAYEHQIGAADEPPHSAHDVALNREALAGQFSYDAVGVELLEWLQEDDRAPEDETEDDGRPAA